MEETKRTVFVYVKDVRTDDYDEIEVSVFATEEKAREALKKDRDDVIEYWENLANGIIDEDTPNDFSAWEDGEFAYNHDRFFIAKKQVN